MSVISDVFSSLKNLLTFSSGFTAASRNYRNNHRKVLVDAEDSVAAEKQFVTERIRHLYWNNLIAQNSVESFVTNLGVLDVIFVDAEGSEIPFWSEAWKVFSSNIDYSGYSNFAALQTMAARCLAVEGEFFARHVVNVGEEFVPFKIETIQTANVPVQYSNWTDQIFYGVQYEKGKPVNYLVAPYSKDIKAVIKASTTWPYGYNIVRADKMIHVWEKKFPEQKRGMPMLTAAAFQLWQHEDLERSVVTQAVNSSSFAYAVKKDKMAANRAINPVTQIRDGVKKSVNSDGQEEEAPIQFYESDAGQILHGDVEVQLLQSKGIENGINEMLGRMQKVIAMTLSSASFQVDGNCSEYNYSSMRAALVAIDTKLTITRKTLTEPLLVLKIVSWWLEAMLADYPEQKKPKVVIRYPKTIVPNLLELMRAYEIALTNGIMPITQIYDELDINPEEFKSSLQKTWAALMKAQQTKPQTSSNTSSGAN